MRVSNTSPLIAEAMSNQKRDTQERLHFVTFNWDECVHPSSVTYCNVGLVKVGFKHVGRSNKRVGRFLISLLSWA